VRVIIPFILQYWLFITPVVYPLSLLPEAVRPLASLNPMTGVVEAFRWCVLGTAMQWEALAWSIAIALGSVISGAFFFRRMERTFVDVL